MFLPSLVAGLPIFEVLLWKMDTGTLDGHLVRAESMRGLSPLSHFISFSLTSLSSSEQSPFAS
jgi:hypothetical protein